MVDTPFTLQPPNNGKSSLSNYNVTARFYQLVGNSKIPYNVVFRHGTFSNNKKKPSKKLFTCSGKHADLRKLSCCYNTRTMPNTVLRGCAICERGRVHESVKIDFEVAKYDCDNHASGVNFGQTRGPARKQLATQILESGQKAHIAHLNLVGSMPPEQLTSRQLRV